MEVQSSVYREFLATNASVWLENTIRSVIEDRVVIPPPPDKFTVQARVVDARSTELLVTVPAAEYGKLVGKQGRTARAIRTLLMPRSARDGVRYVLNIVAAE